MKRFFALTLQPLMLAAVFALLSVSASAQSNAPDAQRMARDIDIMEKVINELFANLTKSYRGNHISNGRSAQGFYLPGYGAIFVAPISSGWMGRSMMVFNTDNNTIFFNHNEKRVSMSHAVSVSGGESEEERKKKLRLDENRQNAEKVKLDSAFRVQTDLLSHTMREFLANYADAITQLRDDEKILIIYDENAHKNAFSYFDNAQQKRISAPRISAEVKREDLVNFRNGKISRKELDGRIKVEKVSEERDQYQEYKVFAGILESLFPVDDQSDYRIRNISYNYMPNFGVIYQIDMSMRKSSWNDCHGCPPVPDISGKTRSKSDTAGTTAKQQAYQKFERDIREVLLDYGRTLRNLSPDHMILLTVSLPTCENCQVPERANISVRKSVLDTYEKGQMDRDKALNSIIFNP